MHRIEVSPELITPTEPGQEHRRIASLVLQDDSGRIRVVLLGNFCYVVDSGRITVGRQVKIALPRARKGQDGQPEIVVQYYYTRVEALPTAEAEEYLRRLRNEGPIMPTRWITRDKNPELYQKVLVTIQVPRGMLEFAKFAAARWCPAGVAGG